MNLNGADFGRLWLAALADRSAPASQSSILRSSLAALTPREVLEPPSGPGARHQTGPVAAVGQVGCRLPRRPGELGEAVVGLGWFPEGLTTWLSVLVTGG